MRIFIICGAFVIGMLFFVAMVLIGTMIMAAVKKEMDNEREPVLTDSPLLEGEFLSAKEDSLGSGLSRVFVKKKNGMTVYGFSSFSVDELNYLYKGKEDAKIPLVKAPGNRAYQMEVDAWDVR